MKAIEFKGLGTIEDEDNDEITYVHGCSRCGAVVFNKQLHLIWHEFRKKSTTNGEVVFQTLPRSL